MTCFFIILNRYLLQRVCTFGRVLYTVQSLIGRCIQTFKRDVFAIAYGYADGGRYVFSVFLVVKTRLYLIDHILCASACIIFISIGTQEGNELISTHSADDIEFSHIASDDTCDFDQDLITDIVAIGIVDVLEIVDIDHQHRSFAGNA